MAETIRRIYQFLRGGNEDTRPVPRSCLTVYKQFVLGTLATAAFCFILGGVAYANVIPNYLMGFELVFGCIILLLIPFETYLLYQAWADINRVAPNDSNSTEIIQHPERRRRRNYGTCNDGEQRDESENVEERPQPSAESPEDSGSHANPEVTLTKGSNEDENDQSLLDTPEINNENLQKPDSETEAVSKQMECSTKSTEASTTTDEQSSEAATEVAD